MAGFRLKISASALWLLAAASLLALEVRATTSRVMPSLIANHPSLTHGPVADRFDVIGNVGTDSISGFVLVIGNLGAVENGEIEITLKAVPAPIGDGVLSPVADRVTRTARKFSYPRDNASSRDLQRSVAIQPPQSERVYFLPNEIAASHREVTHTAVSCRLTAQNHRAFIYVDQRLTTDNALVDLVAAINSVSASAIADTIEQLVGLPADLDGDGHLTIVVTPALDHLGTANGPVHGLTQPSDFVAEIDRPIGNQSDVIYLSSSLTPGEYLKAVLAHEWCHASVFSRHTRRTIDEAAGDEDWLSEAIAHVVEVASSGSDTNIAHRVQSYLARPAESPLIVQNYCDPRYWRHKGCRGAGYLFLKWCIEEYGVELSQLANDRPLSLRGLEAVTQRSFDDLFTDWTANMGKQLAADLERQNPSESRSLAHHTWHLEGMREQTLTIRLKGTCADFIHIPCPTAGRWQVSAMTTESGKLQTSLIPVRESSR